MKFIKRFSPFEIALIITILGIHLYAAFSDAYNFPNAWFTRDDAYYYFKVAQNITEGLGSTFDGINLTNGYHPLWMLVCIPVFALARFDLILPLRILLMVMAVFNAATAVLIYRLVKNNLSHAVAIAAASFWAFNFYIHRTIYEPDLKPRLPHSQSFCSFTNFRSLKKSGAQNLWLHDRLSSLGDYRNDRHVQPP